MTDKTDYLLPCPFCGELPVVDEPDPHDYPREETAMCETPDCGICGVLVVLEDWQKRA